MIKGMKKRVLVAGGSGFIGSHLCETLLGQGHEVICLDSLVTGNKSNTNSFVLNKNFLFVQADTRQLQVDKLPFEGKIDEIYDLASPASVTYISSHPVEAATANSMGTKNLLDIAQNTGATFLFASSSEVYGDPNVHPQTESYWGNVNPVGVRSGYDEGKRFGEALTMAYHREYGVAVRLARIFNTYGPHTSPTDSRVIPRFITQALKNEPLTVHGDGRQTRSFCYVSDMVTGLVAVMDSGQVGPINLGNPQEEQIINIAHKIIALTGSGSTIRFVNRPPDDPARRKPDISLAGLKLRWEPKVDLDKGLAITIAYFKRVL